MKIDPKLVQVDYGLKLKVLDRDGLFYVLVHELGHLVDFKTGINGDCASQFCRPSNGSWASMSWQAASTPLAGLAFFLRDQFCYYGCKKPIAATRAAEIYRSLPASAFVTTYAGQNMREDFAEFFAWSIMTREKGAHLTFTIPAAAAGDEAVVVDMNPAFSANAALKAKLERANQYLQAL